MNCVDWQARIALHAGGDASPGESEEVERHLGECPGCQVFWSGMRESLAVLGEIHAELPEAAYFTAVRRRVIAELERSRSWWRRLAWIPGLAAAVMLLVVFWPRARPVVAPPRMAATIPAAPLSLGTPAKRLPHHQVARVVRREKRDPLTVQIQTSDPNIVIYWIAE
jgi:anti-sigma factor RsiW